MERWVAKLIALGVLFFVVLIATLLPIKVTGMFERQGHRGELWISYLMCFGGGVFLATFGLHMGPDVREIFRHAVNEPYEIDYPLAELVILLGLFLMLFLDKIMDKVQKKQKRMDAQGHNVHISVPEQNGSAHSSPSKKEKSADASTGETIPLKDTDNEQVTLHIPQSELVKDNDSHIHSSVLDIAPDIPEIKSPRSMLLLLALSMDHIFEGMSVGLKHSITSVWSLSLAIIAHEVVIAFSLGMRLVKTCDTLTKILIAATFCSAMEPLGVIIGIVLMETGGSSNPNLVIVNGVLQAVSTGVFMYATFFEILRDELHGNTSLVRLCFMFFGFTVLALMGLIPEESLFGEEQIFATTETPFDFNATDTYSLA